MTNGNGHKDWWKTVAVFLSGVVIAGVPSVVSGLTGPSSADIEHIERQLTMTQVQLARVEEQLGALQDSADELRRLLVENR